MITIPLKDGTEVPALGFGTYRLTGRHCTEMVEAAIGIGYRHIDTAQIYENQEAIAPALASHPREELYLTSKLWIGDHTKGKVPKACDQILRELQTDYLDLLLIHWPDRKVPFAETFEALAKVQEEGKVRNIGVSNFTIRHLEDALATGAPIAVNQVECHPFFYQTELFAFCEEKGIVITAWAPLFKGKVTEDPTLQRIGKRHGKSPSQVTLRWLVQKGHIAIPKTGNVGRAVENFSIFDFELTGDEIGEIDGLNTGERQFDPEFSDFNYA